MSRQIVLLASNFDLYCQMCFLSQEINGVSSQLFLRFCVEILMITTALTIRKPFG